MAYLDQPALYLAVAYWAMALGRGVSREEIAQAFRITAHRAADVMNYILNARQDVVSCSRQLLNSGRGQRQLLLRVTGVTAPAPTVRTPPRKKTSVPRQDIASLRTWFLTRPNPLSGR
ncbi:CaiF/GrlA family transcriptional regulator [Serratia quinivorans]|uniref:CaiF/GrlA family transcriptional regulator n=1 Tax=Serratia quinivorans TaxID=137545 RepID=UPI002E77329E|nr:CaiF/GrlA family transcriptional regulator [Serratia quinivorans]